MRKDGVQPGIRALADEGVDDAAQALLAVDGATLGMVDELLAAVRSKGVRSVLEARLRLIIAKGHSAANDDLLPPGWLVMMARGEMLAAHNLATHCTPDLAWARDKLVDSLAFGLAAIDRIDRELQVAD